MVLLMSLHANSMRVTLHYSISANFNFHPNPLFTNHPVIYFSKWRYC